jgi:hypothetical protein
MTDRQINMLFAQKIMGWHIEAGLWKDKNNKTILNAYDDSWQPTQNVSQMFRCVHQWVKDHNGKYTIRGGRDICGFVCTLILYDSDNKHVSHGIGETEEIAGCSALLATVREVEG